MVSYGEDCYSGRLDMTICFDIESLKYPYILKAGQSQSEIISVQSLGQATFFHLKYENTLFFNKLIFGQDAFDE